MTASWRCKRCQTLLKGNPFRCPSCGYTIYTPEPARPAASGTDTREGSGDE